jgi:amino acid transporter
LSSPSEPPQELLVGEPIASRDDTPLPELPESLAFRVKTKLLGPPLHSGELDEQRLGIPTALAVFSSDCISSSAYATEEILHILIPVVGVYAFSLVVPVTVAILVMLTFLILSYRQTIKEYPTAGGAYMVTRDNFGYKPALVAGVSLLTGYILTVAVSTSAGIAALTSVFPALRDYNVELALLVVVFIAYLNLRGAKESGKIFMVPTYLFIAAMALMIGLGLVHGWLGGGLDHIKLSDGTVGELLKHPTGTDGVADLVMKGAGLWVILGAFASGASALTGVEAISNGVSAFHKPEWKHAQRTLVIMGAILGVCFIGLGLLSTMVHPAPYESGSPTVISQVGKAVFGGGPIGNALYFYLQATTLMVLVLGANTSFADFPRLANFAAGDSYMPRQLMKRGHRLVFSNGIFLLAACAMVLIIVSGASVNRLIPFYGIGVFTSFTMSQGGMARHHLHKRERGWQLGLLVNGLGCLMTLTVTLIFLVKFGSQGAWVILILVPLLVIALVRMNRQYVDEESELEEEAAELAGRRILPKLTVLVMVDDVNRATARALQYGRSLHPSEIRAVHFAIDEQKAKALAEEWTTLGLGRIPLQIVECSDRRVANAALKVAAGESRMGDREVTVLLPRLEYRRAWHRILHDRTGSEIAQAVDVLPRVNVTFVPYHLKAGRLAKDLSVADVIDTHTTAQVPVVTVGAPTRPKPAFEPEADLDEHLARLSGRSDAAAEGGIGSVRFRQRVELEGRVQSMRVQPWSGVATLEITLVDPTGSINVVFLGRRTIAGISAGTRLSVAGVVGSHRGHLALLNPRYRIIA